MLTNSEGTSDSPADSVEEEQHEVRLWKEPADMV